MHRRRNGELCLYVGIYTYKKNTVYRSCTELLLFLFVQERQKNREKKWIEWGRQMTVVDFVYNIITFYTGSLGRWRSLSWRRRRASAFWSWPTSPHNILSYGANRRPIVVCVRSFSPLFHVLIRFFHPSTSSSTFYAKHTQYIILLYKCRTHKSPCE